MTTAPIPSSRAILLLLRQELVQEIADLERLLAAIPVGFTSATRDRLDDTYLYLGIVDWALLLLPEEAAPVQEFPAQAVPVPTPDEPTGGLFGPVIDYLKALWQGIVSDLGGQLWDARRVILSSLSPITGTTAALWSVLDPAAGSLYRRLDQALDDRLPDNLGELGSDVAGLRDQLIDLAKLDIPAAVAGAQEGVASFLGQGLDAFFRGSGDIIGTVLGGAATAFLEELEKAFPIIGGPLFDMLRDLEDMPPEVRPLFAEAAAPTSQVGALLQQGISNSVGAATVGSAMNVLLAPFTYALNRRLTPTHLDVATAIRVGFRFPELVPQMQGELLDQGFDTDRQALLKRMSEALFSAGDLQTLTNRGFISPENAALELERQGWDLISARWGIALRRALPGPADIVRFAVREAFSPDVVARFGQDEDFPEDAIPMAERVGVEADDLRLFWRAHWELPSANQGYEMLHRDIIDLDTLNLLLRTQDVMPFWRQKLVDIAYTSFTRVDIRRFYRQGILSRDDVVRAYKDIGFDPAKAEIQALFVEAEDKDIAFNRALPEIRQQAKLGLLEDPELSAQIVQLAPDPATAQEAQDLLSLDIRGERFGQLLSAYRQALRARRLTPQAFADQLAALGISDALIDHYVQVESVLRPEGADAREDAAMRASGQSVVVRRFREGLINDDAFDSEMASLGYAQAEIDRYSDIARLEFDTNYRLDLVAAALTAYRKDKLTQAQLAANLQTLDIAPTLIDAYIQRELARVSAADPDADQAAMRASGQGVVLRRYKEGWIPASQFSDEMATLGYAASEIARYQLIADLEFDYDWKQDSLNNLRVGYRKDVIDADRFLSSLAELGMSPARAQTHLAREALAKGVLPAD